MAAHQARTLLPLRQPSLRPAVSSLQSSLPKPRSSREDSGLVGRAVSCPPSPSLPSSFCILGIAPPPRGCSALKANSRRLEKTSVSSDLEQA